VATVQAALRFRAAGKQNLARRLIEIAAGHAHGSGTEASDPNTESTETMFAGGKFLDLTSPALETDPTALQKPLDPTLDESMSLSMNTSLSENE